MKIVYRQFSISNLEIRFDVDRFKDVLHALLPKCYFIILYYKLINILFNRLGYNRKFYKFTNK